MDQGGYNNGMGGMGGGDDYYNNTYGGYGDATGNSQQYNTYNDDGTYADGGNNPYQQQKQQQQYYEEGNTNNQQKHHDEYYSTETGNNHYNDGDADYYYPDEQHYDHQQQQQQYGEYSSESYNESMASENSSLPFHSFHDRRPFVVHPNGRPDDYGNYDTAGDPISAVALDDGDGAAGAPRLMYVASHTSHHGDGRGGDLGRRRGGSVHGREGSSHNRGGEAPDGAPSLARGSRMTVFHDDDDGHRGDDDDAAAGDVANGGGFYGGRNVYSSFVAHPEAEPRALDALHSVLFGGGKGILRPSAGGRDRGLRAVQARPSHAYGPPFGPPGVVRDLGSAFGARAAGIHPQGRPDRPEERHCMGITTILPLATACVGSGGRVCAASPSGVRVHTRGGMVMSSREELSGMVCGALLGDMVSVGGASLPPARDGASSSSSSGRARHVHCVDPHRDLKVVSSHTLVRHYSGKAGGGGVGDGSDMCVADMAANGERNNIVVGCSDGTVRVLDGGRRNAEVAKARAQVGGVAKVTVSENLICASGYDSPGVSSPNSPLPYPFPSAHVLIYDVRYLGRGGIPHVFSRAGRQGPRFVNFLDDGTLLMGSGQTFGGFEVVAPFADSVDAAGGAPRANDDAFFQPELTAGEAMTAVDVHDGTLYVGTSYGRMLQYGLNGGRGRTARRRAAPKASLSSTRRRPPAASGESLFRDASGLSATSAVAAVGDPLDMPPFVPPPPPFSVDPSVLLPGSSDAPSDDGYDPLRRRHGPPAWGWNVFDGYALSAAPLLSSEGESLHPRYSRRGFRTTTLGPMGARALVPPSKRWLSKALLAKLSEGSSGASPGGTRGGGGGGGTDFVRVVPTSSLELGDLLAPDPASAAEKVDPSRGDGGGYRGKHKGTDGFENKARTATMNKSFPNPNKFLYSTPSFAACYDATANPRKKMSRDRYDPEHQQPHHAGDEFAIHGEEHGVPLRYRLALRPPFYKASQEAFNYARHNDTGLYVGWDYAPTFANSFACSVLAMLYFVGEVREMALGAQLRGEEMALSSRAGSGGQAGSASRHETNVSITAELGLLFHLIEALSANGMIQPPCSGTDMERGQVKAFVPSNFISAFTLLPEATNLALVDGVAGSAEIARRPEAFYRFLMQYMERELRQLSSHSNLKEEIPITATDTNQGGNLIDHMQGIDFLSIIEYARGKPKVSTSRAFTVDLAYDQKSSKTTNSKVVHFGEILRFSLCKEAPLRAWCDETRSYEAVVQRKIATSLPSLLSLSCCCAGRGNRSGSQSDGLKFWQREDSRNWLPEFVKIRIEMDGSLTVKELVANEDGTEEWMAFEQKLPASLDAPFDEGPPRRGSPIEKSYRLDAVVSFIRSNSDDAASSPAPDSASSCEGHHVVHVRTPVDLEAKALARQLHQIERCLSDKEGQRNSNPDTDNADDHLGTAATVTEQLTLVSGVPLEERRQQVQEQIRKLNEKEEAISDQWLLLNGFVVTKVDDSDDVRSFNAKFKEPSIVLFREITPGADSSNNKDSANNVEPSTELSEPFPRKIVVPVNVVETSSISNSIGPKLAFSDLMNLPTHGDLVAIDAEFVCVQHEESLITSSGSKEITSEPRNALARLSIIDCRTNHVTVDDYVLPREPVVDYLTRFSGIRQNDLDATGSPHHLVTPQESYLKVRLLMERGCIFVGHGLSQDFRVINICIPPNQIIDTAEIFHQPNQRYISLRYLTNYVLGRDMQQEVHDSIEDARAAHELYIKALSLKKEETFDDYLMQLYAHGHRTQFKLGVANDTRCN